MISKLAVLSGGAFAFACVCGATAYNVQTFEPDVTLSGEAPPSAPEKISNWQCDWLPSSGCNSEDPVDTGVPNAPAPKEKVAAVEGANDER